MSDPDDERVREEAAMAGRIEEIRADARRAREQAAERDDTVAFVRELGFDDLLED
jgi:hypothetical protein